MRLKTLLAAALLLTGCDDPGMTANAAEPASDSQKIAGWQRGQLDTYQVRSVVDRKLHNVCYVVTSIEKTQGPAISCLPVMSDDETGCTPSVTSKDGTVFPGVCPDDFEAR